VKELVLVENGFLVGRERSEVVRSLDEVDRCTVAAGALVRADRLVVMLVLLLMVTLNVLGLRVLLVKRRLLQLLQRDRVVAGPYRRRRRCWRILELRHNLMLLLLL
jgi:hypothetical protein